MQAKLAVTSSEAEAILTISLLAAFADGAKSDVERAAIKDIMEKLPATETNHAALYQNVLLGQVSAAQAAQRLERLELRQLAYEMAVCVCDADNLLSPREKSYLDQLRQVLRLDANETKRIEQDSEAVALPDFINAEAAGGKTNDVDGMILNYSILNGALELMPQSLSTLAIIPLQMKMVYRIGKKYGYDLDRGHIKELLAAAGVGLSSQVLEGYATKLFGKLFGTIGGKIGSSVANQATSSAMSFAATYAIGHMAQKYYAGGRTLSTIEMRQLFNQLKEKAGGLHAKYAGQIQQQSRTIDTTQLLNLVRNQ